VQFLDDARDRPQRASGLAGADSVDPTEAQHAQQRAVDNDPLTTITKTSMVSRFYISCVMAIALLGIAPAAEVEASVGFDPDETRIMLGSNISQADHHLIDDEVTVSFDIYNDSDPLILAQQGCRGQYPSCMAMSVPVLRLAMNRQFQHPLSGWQYSEYCQCNMPPQDKQHVLQYLHVPKSGTSINWFLHDYFDNCTSSDGSSDEGGDDGDGDGSQESSPCPQHLAKPIDQITGLCEGRLYSCAGHRVSADLPRLTIHSSTNLLTMLRHPFNRLQSDYHYIRSKPESGHLGPEINVTHLLESVHSVYEYTAYPGIANCATKMLNGIQCCDSDAVLTDRHLDVAKEVLMAMLWFGITEQFKTSVCLLAWMYGGTPRPRHFRKSRQGIYQRRDMSEEFSDIEAEAFLHRERFDLELYRYAVEIFEHRRQHTGCPSID
jgi:hypothetical protein